MPVCRADRDGQRKEEEMNNFDRIPMILRELPQWVCAVEGKKIPLNPATGRAASCSSPMTWGTFEAARKGVEEDDADNIGFVFHNNGIIGVDLDEGVWDEYGLMTPMTAEFLHRFQSYTERSRSGRGIHILVKGTLPWSGRNNRRGVEAYLDGRYFIMTGDTVCDLPIRENQTAIDWMLETYFKDTDGEKVSCDGRGMRIYGAVWERPLKGRVQMIPDYPPITSGSRNLSLASVAGAMHTAGCPVRTIRNELFKVNRSACHPPLDDREIEQIVRSITRYKRK